MHSAFVWKFGGFFPGKCAFGRRDVATSEEGRVNSIKLLSPRTLKEERIVPPELKCWVV